MRSGPVLLVSFAVASLAFGSLLAPPGQGCDSPSPLRVLAVGDPVAVISALPDEVSNGTEVSMDGLNSTYLWGTIDHYEWEISIHGVIVKWSTESSVSYRFRQLGIYLVTLTVTTNDNKTNMAFTAVYSIPDSDSDLMPDWWEMHYFGNLTQSGSSDYDGDGYTNLQEYASGTDPTVKDPPWYVKNWYYFVAAAGIIAVAVALMYPRIKKKRKAEVKKQIAAAIEIEKALEEDK